MFQHLVRPLLSSCSPTMSNRYDVIIAGAGPAGAQCARDLADRGYDVVVLETEGEDEFPAQSNKSTGGTFASMMTSFGIPDDVVMYATESVVLESPNEHSYPQMSVVGSAHPTVGGGASVVALPLTARSPTHRCFATRSSLTTPYRVRGSCLLVRRGSPDRRCRSACTV